jgi:hypothetical protein
MDSGNSKHLCDNGESGIVAGGYKGSVVCPMETCTGQYPPPPPPATSVNDCNQDISSACFGAEGAYKNYYSPNLFWVTARDQCIT